MGTWFFHFFLFYVFLRLSLVNIACHLMRASLVNYYLVLVAEMLDYDNYRPLLIPLSFQLAMSKRAEENKSSPYVIDGSENLGSCLQLQPRSNASPPPPLSKCSIQWCRISPDGSQKEVISGIFSV